MAALFSVITAAFAAVALWAGAAGQWPIAACAGVLAVWMGSLVVARMRNPGS
jgi:hypothetical protein